MRKHKLLAIYIWKIKIKMMKLKQFFKIKFKIIKFLMIKNQLNFYNKFKRYFKILKFNFKMMSHY